MYYLAVQPCYQGHGLGRGLVGAAEAWLGDSIPKVHVMVRRENSAAARFYEHLGYRSSDVVVLSRWPG